MIGQSLRSPAAWIAAFPVLASSTAHAQASPQDAVAQSLVYLTVGFTPTKGPSSGAQMTNQSTGFLVSDDGFILTSYHLLDKVSEYASDHVKVTAAVGGPEESSVTAAIVNGLQPFDVLLLKIRTTKPLPYLVLGKPEVLNIGDLVYTSGFNGTELFNREGTLTRLIHDGCVLGLVTVA